MRKPRFDARRAPHLGAVLRAAPRGAAAESSPGGEAASWMENRGQAGGSATDDVGKTELRAIHQD